MINHRGAMNTCAYINHVFNIQSSDRIFAISSLAFDLSVYDIFGSASSQASIVLPEENQLKDPGSWFTLLSEQHVTVWNSAPALLLLLLDHLSEYQRLPELRLVMLSGDWIPLSVPDRVRKVAPNARIVSLGGATEASIWSIMYEVNHLKPEWTSIPYGFAMANQSWSVLDERLRSCPIGIDGELVIGGLGVAMGYLGDPKKTADRFINHPETGARMYRTGDLGHWMPDGSIVLRGRIDFQVKVSGYRIETGEIEHALQRHPAVREAVVMAVGERSNRFLAAWVRAEALNKADLLAHLSMALPSYMIPKQIMEVENFPVTANGKFDRSALLMALQHVVGGEVVPPRNAEETAVREAFAIVLGLSAEEISVEASFFELGGNSLSGVQLARRLSDALGRAVSVADVLQRPTVSALAARGGGGGTAVALPPLVRRVSADELLRNAHAVSWNQSQLLTVHLGGGAASAYNIPMAHWLVGSLSVSSLRSALEVVVARHAVLRTTYEV